MEKIELDECGYRETDIVLFVRMALHHDKTVDDVHVFIDTDTGDEGSLPVRVKTTDDDTIKTVMIS